MLLYEGKGKTQKDCLLLGGTSKDIGHDSLRISERGGAGGKRQHFCHEGRGNRYRNAKAVRTEGRPKRGLTRAHSLILNLGTETKLAGRTGAGKRLTEAATRAAR